MYIPFEGNDYYPRAGANAGTGEENWNQASTVSYLELQQGVSPDRLAPVMKEMLKLNSQEFISKNLVVKLKPLDKYYLSSNNGAVEKTLSILSLVALSILLLAVINFVNIMTGTSSYPDQGNWFKKSFWWQEKTTRFSISHRVYCTHDVSRNTIYDTLWNFSPCFQ